MRQQVDCGIGNRAVGILRTCSLCITKECNQHNNLPIQVNAGIKEEENDGRMLSFSSCSRDACLIGDMFGQLDMSGNDQENDERGQRFPISVPYAMSEGLCVIP